MVLGTYDADLCRSYIEREMLTLGDYKLTGPVEGPISRTYATNDGNVTVDQAYDAPVSFTFQGQSFNATGGFAIEGGQVYWFTQCR